MTVLHCPDAPPGHQARGSLCRHDCRGPFASRAGDVTCKRCLARGAQAVTKAFVVPVFTASKLPADDFHAHLDACHQCREQPFNLCPTGAARLSRATGGKV